MTVVGQMPATYASLIGTARRGIRLAPTSTLRQRVIVSVSRYLFRRADCESRLELLETTVAEASLGMFASTTGVARRGISMELTWTVKQPTTSLDLTYPFLGMAC